jgi:hypothetical protein
MVEPGGEAVRDVHQIVSGVFPIVATTAVSNSFYLEIEGE